MKQSKLVKSLYSVRKHLFTVGEDEQAKAITAAIKQLDKQYNKLTWWQSYRDTVERLAPVTHEHATDEANGV